MALRDSKATPTTMYSSSTEFEFCPERHPVGLSCQLLMMPDLAGITTYERFPDTWGRETTSLASLEPAVTQVPPTMQQSKLVQLHHR